MYSSTLPSTSALDGGWVVNATPRPLYPRERPIVQEAGWAPGPVCTGVENLAPTGIRSPDLPPRSESLYRLSYSGIGYGNVKAAHTIALYYTRTHTHYLTKPDI